MSVHLNLFGLNIFTALDCLFKVLFFLFSFALADYIRRPVAGDELGRPQQVTSGPIQRAGQCCCLCPAVLHLLTVPLNLSVHPDLYCLSIPTSLVYPSWPFLPVLFIIPCLSSLTSLGCLSFSGVLIWAKLRTILCTKCLQTVREQFSQ